VEPSADLIRFLATSAEDVGDVCEIIRSNDLELVAVELFAAPKNSGAAAELFLVFGHAPSEDAAA
jgi:hypothetical protein